MCENKQLGLAGHPKPRLKNLFCKIFLIINENYKNTSTDLIHLTRKDLISLKIFSLSVFYYCLIQNLRTLIKHSQ